MTIWKANPQIVDELREAGALLTAEKFTHSYMHCWRHKTPIIYRATTQWFAGMDDEAERRRRQDAARDRAAQASRRPQFYPGVGQGAPARHDRQPPRLDAVAAAPVGRADAVLRAQGNRRAASAHAGAARSRSRKRVEQGGIEAWQTLDPSELLGADADTYEQEQRHARRLVRLRLDAPDVLRGCARTGSHDRNLPGRPLPRRLGPASRLVPFVAADRRAC